MNVERIKELSVLLRDQTKWPEGFVWNFHMHEGCAMGLIAIEGTTFISTIAMAEFLEIPRNRARNLFLYAQMDNPTEEERLNIEDREITPETIAGLLDELVV